MPAPPGPIYFPPPPERPRFVYEAVFRAGRDIQQESEAQRMRRIMTGQQIPENRFVKPLDIAASGGRAYVSDTQAPLIHVFDFPRQRYFAFGYRLEGALKKPAGIAVDGNGRVYVADVGRKQVVIYDALGLYVGAIGVEGELHRPTGVDVDDASGRIYVVDNGGIDQDRHAVLVFDHDGKRLFDFGVRGGQPGEFNLPVDIAISRQGRVFVLDAGNFRVQVFDFEGNFLSQWGEVGRDFGQFARPRHLAVDNKERVYVSDGSFGNVQLFKPDGTLLLAIGTSGIEDRPGRFGLVAGVDVDESGRLYVVDQLHLKFEVYRSLESNENISVKNTSG